MRDSYPIVDLVAALLAELGLRADRTDEADELRMLVAAPWEAYRAGRGRSALTSSGAPFELSIELDPAGVTALRYVVDVADPGLGLVDNGDHYRRMANAITGTDTDDLFDRYLRCVSPTQPARIMHGVGFTGRDGRRATLYFPTPWLGPDQVADLLPDDVTVSGRVEVVGHDYVNGNATRWKTYQWHPAGDTAGLDGPGPAVRLHDEFIPALLAADRNKTLLLQRSSTGPKLFFFAEPWGWQTPDGMAALFRFLQSAVILDLAPLKTLGAATERHDVRLTLGLLAVGGDDVRPTVTLYFWPV